MLISKVMEQGWTYIYRVIIAYLVYNQELLLSEDNSGIIIILSSQNYKINTQMVSQPSYKIP